MSAAPPVPLARRQAKPHLIGEACVHALSPLASCEACVVICPWQAWQLTLGELSLDVCNCDGCGLCRAVCPEQAIELAMPALLRDLPGGGRAIFAACERACTGSGQGTVPCAHGFRHEDLESWSRQAAGEMVVATDNCDDCPRGGASRLEHTIAGFNAIAAARARPRLKLRYVSARQWDCELAASRPCDDEPDMKRRSFLRVFTGGLTELTNDNPAAEPRDRVGQLARFVPRIDVARCQACDACTELCPHGALRKEADLDGSVSYCLAADSCTGCGICSDVCAWAAVEIEPGAKVVQTQVELVSAHCKRCGIRFQIPRQSDADGSLCGTCQRTGGRNRLFQVLD